MAKHAVWLIEKFSNRTSSVGASFSVCPNDLLLFSFIPNTSVSVIHMSAIWNRFSHLYWLHFTLLIFSLSSPRQQDEISWSFPWIYALTVFLLLIQSTVFPQIEWLPIVLWMNCGFLSIKILYDWLIARDSLQAHVIQFGLFKIEYR